MESEDQPYYKVPTVAKMLHYNRETTRQLIMGQPGVIQRCRGGHYFVPLSVVERIKRELTVARETVQS